MFYKIALIMATCLCSGVMVLSQTFAGDWAGRIQVQGQSLNIVFHVKYDNGVWSGKMDSPDQSVFDIPIGKVSVENGKLLVNMDNLKLSYEAELAATDSLKGSFKQGDFTAPLSMGRMGDGQALRPKRPQEPKPKFSYDIREVEFTNESAGIRLAGTLTMPKGKGPFPAVILVSGSGPQDRNEEIFGHKPFWVIADYFAKNGIAVLRYDDRGVGASKGKFSEATSLDFVGDAKAAFDFLRQQKGIDPAKTGVVGHSEGGMIAPMLAAEDNNVAFMVLLAGPGIPINQLMLIQTRLVGETMGKNKEALDSEVAMNEKVYDILLHQPDDQKAKQELDDLIQKENAGKAEADKMSEKDMMAMFKQVFSPWFRYFIMYDPGVVLEKVQCPVLALNGGKDVQVTASENLSGIRAAAERSGNEHVETRELEKLNHLFQTAETGAVSEYARLEETFSPEVLVLMADWIRKL